MFGKIIISNSYTQSLLYWINYFISYRNIFDKNEFRYFHVVESRALLGFAFLAIILNFLFCYLSKVTLNVFFYCSNIETMRKLWETRSCDWISSAIDLVPNVSASIREIWCLPIKMASRIYLIDVFWLFLCWKYINFNIF